MSSNTIASANLVETTAEYNALMGSMILMEPQALSDEGQPVFDSLGQTPQSADVVDLGLPPHGSQQEELPTEPLDFQFASLDIDDGGAAAFPTPPGTPEGGLDSDDQGGSIAIRNIRRHKMRDLVRRYAFDIMQITEVHGIHGGTFATAFPAEPLNADSDYPTYPETIANGRFTMAWPQVANHEYNIHSAVVLAQGLLADPAYNNGLTSKELPSIIATAVQQFQWLCNKRRQSFQQQDTVAMLRKRAATAAAARQRRLFKRRRDTLSQFEDLNVHAEAFDRLGQDGMSSDEEDVSTHTYLVSRKMWRAPELETFLRFLSDFSLASRGFRGPGFRHEQRRRCSEKVSTSKPPRGLPKNWYDDGWYARLSEAKKQRLNAGEPQYLILPDPFSRLTEYDGDNGSGHASA